MSVDQLDGALGRSHSDSADSYDEMCSFELAGYGHFAHANRVTDTENSQQWPSFPRRGSDDTHRSSFRIDRHLSYDARGSCNRHAHPVPSLTFVGSDTLPLDSSLRAHSAC